MRARPQRPRPLAGALLLVCALPCALPLSAQDTIPRTRPDTVVVDTVIVHPDAVRLPAAQDDTIQPAPRFPEFSAMQLEGWSAGVWVFDEAMLQLQASYTLADLLERIPGLNAVRAGQLNQPEGVGGWGWGGGRVEILLDGFLLDPLDAAAVDLSRIELLHLRRVRVERRLDRLRIELDTRVAEEPRPYSRVEAGTGDFRTDMLRGLIVAPRVLAGPLAAGVERLASDGLQRQEPASTFSLWGKWAITGPRAGLQIEGRRHELDRRGQSPYRGAFTRTDWVLRGRARPHEALLAEAFLGASSVDDAFTAAVEPVEIAMRSRQYGGRLEWSVSPVWIRGSARLRDGGVLPGNEQILQAGIRPFASLSIEGELRREGWSGGSASSAFARAVVRPVSSLSLFGEWADGQAAGPGAADTAGEVLVTRRGGGRLGAELLLRDFRFGVAGVRLSGDSVLTYGLPFDSPVAATPAGTAPGIEVVGRVPLFLRGLAAEGEYAYWFGDTWIYQPLEIARLRLVYHDLPLPSGNLEVLARLEGVYRGQSLVGSPEGAVAVPESRRLDFYLQVRVLDVRVFVVWENITFQPDLQDIPGRELPRQRALYGVKWQFWN